MKTVFLKVVDLLLCCCLVLTLLACSEETANTEQPSPDTANNNVHISVDFEENLIFSTYAVYLEIGGRKEKMAHGKDSEFDFQLEPGTHSIIFRSADNSAISNTVELDVRGDIVAKYKISCHYDRISVKTISVETLGSSEDHTEITTVPTSIHEEDSPYHFADAESFEAALNSGEKVNGKTVKFLVNDYVPTSILGINCWAGEHLNFISEYELDVEAGDYIVGRITKEASKVFDSWEIHYEVLEINGVPYKSEQEISSDTQTETTSSALAPTTSDDIGVPESTEAIEPTEVTDASSISPEEILTLENSSELSAFLNLPVETDIEIQAQYIAPLQDKTIEIVTVVALTFPYTDSDTHYDILLFAYEEGGRGAYGPALIIEDIYVENLGIPEIDHIEGFMKFRCVARIEGINDDYQAVDLSLLSLEYIYSSIPTDPVSEYEIAFVREMSNYSLYYMFDTDNQTVVCFGTHDTYVDKGTYTGGFSSGITINWSHGEWTERFVHKDGAQYATMTDGNGFEWEYKTCDVETAQAVLDELQ